MTQNGKAFEPLKCLIDPAPTEIIKLEKCSCKSGCTKGRCSCTKNKLNCTPLCKCYSTNCSNFADLNPEEVSFHDTEGENIEGHESDLLFSL